MERKNLFLAGDSTCQYNYKPTFPQVGWGQFLADYIDGVSIKNYAKNGRSTKSYINEGRLDQIDREIEKGDYLLIQFGHNDQKQDEERATDAYGSYSSNLKLFISIARKHGATPILLTSVSRRHFDESGNLKSNIHLDYPDAMRKVAKTEGVALIDIYSKSRDWLSELGADESKECFMNFAPGKYENYPEGKEDDTHLREKGARVIAGFVAEGLKKIFSQE